MPVESATYIDTLNAADPVHTDGLNVADSHLRLIKTVLQNTFPNLNAAVTTTPAQLNVLAGATVGSLFAVQGVLDVPQVSATVGAEVVLTPPNDSGGDVILWNAAAAGASGALAIIANDSGNANPATLLTATTAGAVAALLSLDAPTIKQAGHPLLPTGMIMLWSGSTATIPTGWLICDGSNGTPDLRDRFVVGAGSTYSPSGTGGALTLGATSSSNGAHTHSGTTGSGGGQSMTGSADAQGNHSHGASTASHQLTTAEMPNHTHGFSTQSSGGGAANGLPDSNAGSAGPDGVTQATGSDSGHSHAISLDGSHTHNITVSSVAAHAHVISSDGAHTHTVSGNILPPYFALAYIMKS